MPEKPHTRWIEKVWKLPPPEERRDRIIPLTLTYPFLDLKKDGEYLCYLSTKISIFIGAVLLSVLVLDIFLGTSIFIDLQSFQNNKLFLSVTYSRIVVPALFGIAIIFYLRLRLAINMRHNTIPIMIHRALLLSYPRWRWIVRALFFISICALTAVFNHIVVIRFVMHFDMQDSFLFVLLTQIAIVLGLAPVPAFIMSYALVLEKVIRFFPEFTDDLLTMNPLPRNY